MPHCKAFQVMDKYKEMKMVILQDFTKFKLLASPKPQFSTNPKKNLNLYSQATKKSSCFLSPHSAPSSTHNSQLQIPC